MGSDFKCGSTLPASKSFKKLKCIHCKCLLHDKVSPIVCTFYIFGIIYIVVCGYQWKLEVFCVIACSMTAQTMVVFLDPVSKSTLFHLSLIFQFGIFKF